MTEKIRVLKKAAALLLAGGCGDTNGKPQIDKTEHLTAAYRFGKEIYAE